MIGNVILYLVSFILFSWGTAHIVSTGNVVSDFGDLTDDHRRTITMEWIIEGVSLVFIGILLSVVTYIDKQSPISFAVYWMAFGVLNTLSIVSLFTGCRNKFIMFKLCPFIFTGSAILIIVTRYLV